jgi:nucleoside-diphosphate-sugar epimerase
LRNLITGAGGFIGRSLVSRLLSDDKRSVAGSAGDDLVLVDRRLEYPSDAPHFRDSDVLARAFSRPVDCIFHLASTPGGVAESDFDLGMSVNVEGTRTLLDTVRRLGMNPRLVFASSIGVYGVPMPPQIDRLTVAQPTFSYGAQKLMGETLVAEYSRRGWIDGVSLRLPGIVARPRADGMISIFMSDLIRELSAGRPFTCPVSPQGVAWFMSRECVVDNLLHAAGLPAEALHRRRTWLLPVLRATIAEIVDGIAETRGTPVAALISYVPNPAIEAQFGCYPPLHCPESETAGFHHDGTIAQLVRRALIEV